MRKLYLAIVLLFGLKTVALSQIEILYIKPILTDTRYLDIENNNLVVRNKVVHLNKLVLFIGGSSADPTNYATFCKYSASLGFDVISLSYPNNISTTSLNTSADSLIFNKYHQELCFGTPVSGDVTIDTLNSINTRAVKLIQYLSLNYPKQNWDQYLANPTALDWTKITISGHSQGAGHAGYLAKKFPVERVLMFSGPNDFSTFYNKSANWLRQEGVTPAVKHFALLHLKDELVPFNRQFIDVKGLGMLVTVDSTLVDNLSAPYSNANVLYTKIDASSYHNSTIGSNAVLPAVWNYMLSPSANPDPHPDPNPDPDPSTVTGTNDLRASNESLHAYPNPTIFDLMIEIPQHTKADSVSILNAFGQLVLEASIVNKESLTVDFANLKQGLYFIKIGNRSTRVVKN